MSDLDDEITRLNGGGPIPAEIAKSLLADIAMRHVNDASSIYWWSSLKGKAQVIEYDGGTSGIALVSSILTDIGDDSVYLIVTDDEPSPWSVFKVVREDLMEVLSELPFFEYFVSTMDCSFLLFDTHENNIIVSRC